MGRSADDPMAPPIDGKIGICKARFRCLASLNLFGCFHLGLLLKLLFNLRAERVAKGGKGSFSCLLPSSLRRLPVRPKQSFQAREGREGKGREVGSEEVLFIAGGMNREEIGEGGKNESNCQALIQ